jgi:hypothetical protein
MARAMEKTKPKDSTMIKEVRVMVWVKNMATGERQRMEKDRRERF